MIQHKRSATLKDTGKGLLLSTAALSIAVLTVLTASRFQQTPASSQPGSTAFMASASITQADISRVKSANSSKYDSIVSGNPQIVVDEDFTDGAFDNLNAFNAQNQQQWFLYGGTVRWGVPFNRPGAPPVAILRNPAAGGAAWEGVSWHSRPQVDYHVNKVDDISVARWAAFSDVGRNAETYGIELAMLDENPDPIFVGNPHFGHDLSWEGLIAYSNSRAQGAMQLEGNLENNNNRSPNGVRRANWTQNGGYPTDSAFAQIYDNTMLWRNRLDTRKTNIEQWGHANYADYDVDTMMTSIMEPDSPYGKFNLIQVALFRGGLSTSNPFIKRSTVPDDSLQIGITKVHVGITKRSDFNLDYAINQADADVLADNWGRTDTTTIKQGDATNDNKIDVNDALPLAAFWNRGVSTADTISARATYNATTGEVVLNLRNISVFKIVSSTGAILTTSTPNFAGLSPMATNLSDTMMGAFTTTPWNVTNYSLGNILPAGLNAGTLFLTMNYLGSDYSNGFVVPFNLSFTVNNKGLLGETRLAKIDGETLKLPVTAQAATIVVHSLDGKQLLKKTLPAGQNLINLGSTRSTKAIRIVSVIDANDKPIYQTKYMPKGQ